MEAYPPETCISEYKYVFQNNLLRGKVAFVTGGATGIGFTIAEIFMRHGCDVAIASRNAERLNAAAKTLSDGTGRVCLAVKMDVRKPADIQEAFQSVLNKFGRVDIVVNGAAGNFPSPASGLSFNAFKTVIEIDTVGTFNVSKVAFEKYLQNHGGVIVNITATLHYRGQVMQAHAGPAKAAIDALTKHLAVEWADNKVRVVGVAPGPIADTEGMRKLGKVLRGHPHLQAGNSPRTTETVPLGRMGTRSEIAHAVLFLASEAGAYITGETLVVDGGAWLSGANSMSAAAAMFSKI